jgi:hypothetical protein
MGAIDPKRKVVATDSMSRIDVKLPLQIAAVDLAVKGSIERDRPGSGKAPFPSPEQPHLRARASAAGHAFARLASGQVSQKPFRWVRSEWHQLRLGWGRGPSATISRSRPVIEIQCSAHARSARAGLTCESCHASVETMSRMMLRRAGFPMLEKARIRRHPSSAASEESCRLEKSSREQGSPITASAASSLFSIPCVSHAGAPAHAERGLTWTRWDVYVQCAATTGFARRA